MESSAPWTAKRSTVPVAKAEAIGIANVRRHIFLCCDQTTPKCCELEASLESWSYLKRRLVEVGLTESGTVMRTKANCLRICVPAPSRSFTRRASGTGVARRKFWNG